LNFEPHGKIDFRWSLKIAKFAYFHVFCVEMAGLLGGTNQPPIDDPNLNNLRDILQMYNVITDNCFADCIHNLNSFTVSDSEEKCLSSCSGKFINSNQRLMGAFTVLQEAKQKAMIKEVVELQQAEAAAEAAAMQAESSPVESTPLDPSSEQSAADPEQKSHKGFKLLDKET